MGFEITHVVGGLGRIGHRAGAFCVVVLLVSCGGSGSGSPVSPTAGSGPRLLQQGGFSLNAPQDDGGLFFALTTITDPAAGRWEATVNWTFETNTMWMWVANGVCTADQFSRDECPFEASCPCQFTIRSETATPKPRVLTIPNAPGGARTLIVMNLGPREESGTYSVTLTSSSMISGEGAPASSTSSGSASAVSIGRKSVRREHAR
jgi:hypothetical protein